LSHRFKVSFVFFIRQQHLIKKHSFVGSTIFHVFTSSIKTNIYSTAAFNDEF